MTWTLWICKFGTVPGSMSCVEKKFELQTRKWEEYKDTRYYDGDKTLVVEFQEWDTSTGTDDARAPVAMVVNSSELRAVDFHLVEVRSLQLDAMARRGRRTRGEAVRKFQVVGNSTFVLPWKTTMTSGHDVSEYLGTLGLVKSYFFKFFGKKNENKIEGKKISWCSNDPRG